MNCSSKTFEAYSEALGKWYIINAFSAEKRLFRNCFFTDITETKQKRAGINRKKGKKITQLYEEVFSFRRGN